MTRTNEALKDPVDQAVLQTLLASNAQYLITDDKGILALAGAYPIITPTGFGGMGFKRKASEKPLFSTG